MEENRVNVEPSVTVNNLYYSMDITDENIKNYVDRYFIQLEDFRTRDGAGSLPPIGEWDVSRVTNMSRLFEGRDMDVLDIGNWNVSSVTNMSYMFNNCEFLKYFDEHSYLWDVSSVTDMSYMFNNCKSLEFLFIGNWNVSSVTNMSYMFNNCESLDRFYLSHAEGLSRIWNVSNVIDMSYMFNNCKLLISIVGLIHWDVSNVENMSYMFNGCTRMDDINLSSWQVKKVKNWDHMFDGTPIEENYPHQPDFYSHALSSMHAGKRRTKQKRRRRRTKRNHLRV